VCLLSLILVLIPLGYTIVKSVSCAFFYSH
jgi:hypothetical protein